MESITAFMDKLETELDEIEKGTLQPESNFRDLEHWSSMHALIIIAFADTEYDVTLTGENIRQSKTIQDLYNTIAQLHGQDA